MVKKSVDEILQGNLDKKFSTQVYLESYCEEKNHEMIKDDQDMYYIENLNQQENDNDGQEYPKE